MTIYRENAGHFDDNFCEYYNREDSHLF